MNRRSLVGALALAIVLPPPTVAFAQAATRPVRVYDVRVEGDDVIVSTGP